MLSVDLIGLIVTIVIVGIRYPHVVLLAALANNVAQLVMALFLYGSIEAIIASGAFGSVVINNNAALHIKILVLVSGPLANYYLCKLTGGIAYEPTFELFSPVVKLRHPFAVINFRFALLSVGLIIYNIAVR